MATKFIEVNHEYLAKWGLEEYLKERPSTVAIVAIDMEDAVGGLFFTDGYITHVHVCEDFRRGGFGSQLLEYANNVLAKEKSTKVVVGDHNPIAQAFFLKNGYRYAGRSILGNDTAALMERKVTLPKEGEHANREAILGTAIADMCAAMYTVEIAPVRIK